MTVREFISTIRNDFNSIHLDDYLSGEYIYWKGITTLQLIIKREIDSRKLLNNSSLFSYQNCVEMIPGDCKNCTDIPLDEDSYVSSKEALPDMFQTSFGEILGVTSIDNSTVFKKTTRRDYGNLQKKKYPSKTPYYWIEENHLIIPDSEILAVNIQYLSFDLVGIKRLVGGCESILDYDFPSPTYLLSPTIEKTKESILLSKKLPTDEDSNLNSNDKV